MRKLIVSEFITLDGVIQAPGGVEKPIWRNTTIIRGDVVEAVRALKAQPGKNILTDGSSQLVHALLAADLVDELQLLLYPLAVGDGKRLFPEQVTTRFVFKEAAPYPSGVVGLHYVRERKAD
jgi:dihydrofolate reductase